MQGLISPKIRTLKAAQPFLTNAEISRMVGCTPANVTQVLRRVPSFLRTAHNSLTPDELNYLKREAKKHEITVEQMAVGFLRDAIYDAQQAEVNS